MENDRLAAPPTWKLNTALGRRALLDKFFKASVAAEVLALANVDPASAQQSSSEYSLINPDDNSNHQVIKPVIKDAILGALMGIGFGKVSGLFETEKSDLSYEHAFIPSTYHPRRAFITLAIYGAITGGMVGEIW